MPLTRLRSFVRREILWLGLGLVVGFVVLPVALYEVGNRTLGPYAGGSRAELTQAIYGDFLALRPAAWILLLGPLALLFVLRLAWRGLARR